MPKPGDTVLVEGIRLTEKIKVLVGDEDVELNVETSTEASFVVPSEIKTGKTTDVEFLLSGISLKTLPLAIGEAENVMNITVDSICDDTIIAIQRDKSFAVSAAVKMKKKLRKHAARMDRPTAWRPKNSQLSTKCKLWKTKRQRFLAL